MLLYLADVALNHASTALLVRPTADSKLPVVCTYTSCNSALASATEDQQTVILIRILTAKYVLMDFRWHKRDVYGPSPRRMYEIRI